MLPDDFLGLFPCFGPLEAGDLQQLRAEAWPFAEAPKELHQSLQPKLVHRLIGMVVPDCFQDHAQPDLERQIRDQLVGYYPAKEDRGRGERLQRVVDIMRVLVEQAVNHARKDVLVERIPGPLVPLQDFDDVADLDFVAIHPPVVLLHFGVGS